MSPFLRFTAFVLVFTAGAAVMFVAQSVMRTEPKVREITKPVAHQGPESSTPRPIENSPTVTAAELPPALTSGMPPPAAPSDDLRVSCVTEPAVGRFARMSLATSQAVAFIDVKPGDRVKKGWQLFSHWESPERLKAAKTELAKTRKLLDIAKSQSAAADKTLARTKKAGTGITAQELQDAETAAIVRQHESDAAELAVSESESRYSAMEFEFKQAFVTSPIDGIVVAVDVVLGERRQVGGAFRGVTVVDPSVLYARCLLSQRQVALLTRSEGNGKPSESSKDSREGDTAHAVRVSLESDGERWDAKIESVSAAAEAESGMVPVILEIENPKGNLRPGIRADVIFHDLLKVT